MFVLAAVVGVGLAIAGVVKALSSKPRHAPGEEERREADRRDREFQKEERRIQQRMEQQQASHNRKMADLETTNQTQQAARQREMDDLQNQAENIKRARDENKRRAEEQQRFIETEWPRPAWLETNEQTMNFGVTGASGAGKSSLINALLGKRPNDPGAAQVGVTETTITPTPYAAPAAQLGTMKLWDLPGAGTQRFPRDNYIKVMGLRYFDGLLIVTATRFTEVDVMLFREARVWKIPCYLVRTKADVDIESGTEDYGKTPAITVQELRSDLQQRMSLHNVQNGQATDMNRIFVTTSRRNKFQDVLGVDFQRLENMMASDVREHRQRND